MVHPSNPWTRLHMPAPMRQEIVYALTNPLSFRLPWIEIGMTTRQIRVRIGELSGTSVPFPYDLQFAFEVPNAVEAEDRLHRQFAGVRAREEREFFLADMHEVETAMRSFPGARDITLQVFSNPSLLPDEIDTSEPKLPAPEDDGSAQTSSGDVFENGPAERRRYHSSAQRRNRNDPR